MTSDPIGLAGGLNTYGYALANPVKYFDSTGLATNFTSCKLDCYLVYDWAKKDQLDDWFKNTNNCPLKNTLRGGSNCIIGGISHDIGRTVVNDNRLERCLNKCNSEYSTCEQNSDAWKGSYPIWQYQYDMDFWIEL